MTPAEVLVLRADEDDRARIAAWLSTPEVAGPLFVEPPVTAADLLAGTLRLCDDEEVDGVEDVEARALAIVTGGALAGFALDYGWDFDADPRRELDVALPALGTPSPGLYQQIMAALCHFELTTPTRSSIPTAARSPPTPCTAHPRSRCTR
jgi:hypothetical protein